MKYSNLSRSIIAVLLIAVCLISSHESVEAKSNKTVVDDGDEWIESMEAYAIGYTIKPVKFKDYNGCTVKSSEINIDMDRLMELYKADIKSPSWDDKKRINDMAVLWNFLVEQQGVPPKNAAGILGNFYVEGTFAQIEGTMESAKDMKQVRSILSNGKKSLGIAQWKHPQVQRTCLSFYEASHEVFSDSWTRTKIAAECSCVIEELKAYRVFDSIYRETTVEDATGRVSCQYERYRNYTLDWTKKDGKYHVIRGGSSGNRRYYYATKIYSYFKGNKKFM